jgi:hypothetical protein
MGLVLSSSSRSYTAPKPYATPREPSGRPKNRKKAAKVKAGNGGVTTSQIVGGAVVVGLSAVLAGLVWSSFSR